MGYCTVDDLCSLFPAFARNASNSLSDPQLQSWIDLRAARIRSTFLTRNIDPDALQLTSSQANILRALNLDGVAADLADALQLRITTATGEVALADGHRQNFERVLAEIKVGVYDTLFTKPSRVAGVAGGETDADETLEDRGENKNFGANWPPY